MRVDSRFHTIHPLSMMKDSTAKDKNNEKGKEDEEGVVSFKVHLERETQKLDVKK